MECTSGWAPSTHLNAPEDAMGVYSVLGTTEDGRCVVIALIARAMAANTKGEQGSGQSTGTIWKCASAMEGMFFKSSPDKRWLCLPPWGCFESRAWGLLSPRVIITQPSLKLKFSKADRLGLCLSQTSWAKSQWQGFIPGKLFTN